MKKNELVAAIAAKESITKKDAETYLKAVLETIQDALVAGEKVSIIGFGTFEVRDRPAKKCINPATKKEMTTKPCKALAFKAGKTLKDELNAPKKKTAKKK